MQIKDIVPSQSQQLFICGQSGSGKTTLMRRIMHELKNDLIIVIDSKPEWDNLESFFADTKEPKKLEMKFLWMLNNPKSKGTYVYQTNLEVPAFLDDNVNTIIFWALRRYDRIKKKKGITIVFDEIADFTKGIYTTPAISKLIRQGRSKQVRRILSSQRPSGIPQLAIDQSQKFCVFMLLNRNDRKRMADWVHPVFMRPVSGHDFYYYEIPHGEESHVKLIKQEKRKDA